MKEGWSPNPLCSHQQAPTDIRSLLQKQFEEAFAKHPSLSLDEAFYLEAARMHIQVAKKIVQVSKVRREIYTLYKQLGVQVWESKGGECPQQSDSCNDSRRRRVRRTAVQIARHYYCSIDKCNKSYGSQGSLNQHMKLKHKGHYAKQLLMLEGHRQSSPNSH